MSGENFAEAKTAVRTIFTHVKAVLEGLGVTVDMTPDGMKAGVQESGAGVTAWWNWSLWRVVETPAHPPGTLRVLCGEAPPHGTSAEVQLRVRKKEHKQHREAERFVRALLRNGWSDQVQSVILFQMMRKRVPHLGLTLKVAEGRDGFPERRVELYSEALEATLCVADEGNGDVRLGRGSFVEPDSHEGQLLQDVVESFALWSISATREEFGEEGAAVAEAKEAVGAASEEAKSEQGVPSDETRAGSQPQPPVDIETVLTLLDQVKLPLPPMAKLAFLIGFAAGKGSE